MSPFRLPLLTAILTSMLWPAAYAQYGSPSSLKDEMGTAQDLSFSRDSAGQLTKVALANTLHFPASSTSPVPVLLVLPTCSGISQHIHEWTQAALQAGYGVMAVDSLRGLGNDCGSPSKISNGRYVKDALDAVAFVTQQPGVEPQRIAVLGFSKGALIATWLASSTVADTLRPNTPRISASVSIYGFCALGPTRGRPQGITILQPDTDRSFLALMGAKDNELPPRSCLELLPKLKAAGAPVQWHVYEQAGHAWDSQDKHGFSKTTVTTGERITYQYDPDVTQASRKRVFDFLLQSVQAVPKGALPQ